MTGPRMPVPNFRCLYCGQDFSCRRNKLPRHGRKFCSVSCSAKFQVRPKDFGQRRIDRNGYYVLKRGGRYVPEHRLVMEEKIGRRLFDFENVHHINGQKLDNCPENLEIWNHKHPCGQRVADKVAFAKEIIRLYPSYDVPPFSIDGLLSAAA